MRTAEASRPSVSIHRASEKGMESALERAEREMRAAELASAEKKKKLMQVWFFLKKIFSLFG